MKFERVFLIFLLGLAILYISQLLWGLILPEPGPQLQATAVPQPLVIQMVPAGATAVPGEALIIECGVAHVGGEVWTGAAGTMGCGLYGVLR